MNKANEIILKFLFLRILAKIQKFKTLSRDFFSNTTSLLVVLTNK